MENKAFEELADIINQHKLYIIEHQEFDNIKEFFFYKLSDKKSFNTVKIKDKYIIPKGRIIYHKKANELAIDWDGKPPELIVMGLNGYLHSKYGKIPEDYLLTEKGDLIDYQIIQA
ncbi:hypothetical protein ISS04_04190 [Candidatus Woesearchaeota archaeon]|nr:hypothetical protein [Candidatus Woesearchaeota archaeon]